MKFVQLSYHFEYRSQVEEILDEHEIPHYVRYSMMEGKNSDGKHFGSQVHPGNVSVIEAHVPEDELDDLMDALGNFKHEKEAHEHLEAAVLPIERRLE